MINLFQLRLWLSNNEATINQSGAVMFRKVIISLVMLAVILSTYSEGIVSAAFALFAFSLLIYYAINKTQPNTQD